MTDKNTAPCPNFRKCGGCQLQNLPYSEQLLHKQRQLVSLLGEFCHVNDIIGMDEPTHYRNKVCALSVSTGSAISYPAYTRPGATA